MSDIFAANFDLDYFEWLMSSCVAAVTCGVLLPFGSWCAGMVVEAFLKVVKAAFKR